MSFFVVEIGYNSIPKQVIPANSFREAKEICAGIAEKYYLSPNKIEDEIMLEEELPGGYFSSDKNDTRGVWVITE